MASTMGLTKLTNLSFIVPVIIVALAAIYLSNNVPQVSRVVS